MKILLAVDGSVYSTKAAKHVATNLNWFQGDSEIHLLYVQTAIPVARARAALGKEAVDNYYREESQAALAPTEKILRKKEIPFRSSFVVGDIAEQIQSYVKKNKINLLVMGTRGHGAFRNLVMGSVATKVLAETTVPVLLIR